MFNLDAHEELPGFGDGQPRDYLREAWAILEGRTLLLPTRQHLQAMGDRIIELSAELAPKEQQ
jgi:hypothetical protein